MAEVSRIKGWLTAIPPLAVLAPHRGTPDNDGLCWMRNIWLVISADSLETKLFTNLIVAVETIFAKSGKSPYPINPNQTVMAIRKKIRLNGGISGTTSVKMKAVRA